MNPELQARLAELVDRLDEFADALAEAAVRAITENNEAKVA